MARIAKHWTHERLAENLRTASHAQMVDAAAMEWTLRDVGDIRKVSDARAQQEIRCQLCNHEILRYAVLANSVNGVLLIAGLDCLRKLVAFLESGSIEAPLRNGAANRAYLNTLIGALRNSLDAESDRELGMRLSNKTVLGWFEEELEAGRLPEDVARLVRLAQADVLPSKQDAECLVAHYKEHRLLPIEVLVPRKALHALERFRRRLPTMIPIATIPRILRLAERADRLTETHRRRRDCAARRTWLTEQLAQFRHCRLLPTTIPDEALERVAQIISRDRLLTAQLRLPAAFAELDRLLTELRREIPGSDWYLQTDVEKLRTKVAAAADDPPGYAHQDLLRRTTEWIRVVQIQLTSPMVRVCVDPKPALPIIFSVEEDGSWRYQRWFVRDDQRPARAGVYTARLISSRDLFAFTEAPGTEPRPAAFTLDIPLEQSPFHDRYHGLGGRDGDRWVIPMPRQLWRPGTYRCLVLRESTDHLLVYPVARERARRRATR